MPEAHVRWRLRDRKRVLIAVVLVLAVIAVPVGWLGVRHLRAGQLHQDLQIAGQAPAAAPRASSPAPVAAASGPPFVTSVSASGRYLQDQYGKPLLVRGDSPWALMTLLSPSQAGLWFANRQKYGVNAAIVSLIGATGNGGPKDDGATYDGLLPFVNGDILQWQEPYWQRMDDYLTMAQKHGITLMLYPIDGWTVGNSFVPDSITQCQSYGAKLAARYKDYPNIVWMSGGDYFPATENLAEGSDVDHCIDAMMVGLRNNGDRHLFSIQLGYQKSLSTDNPYWASRVDWNFVYTYYPTYKAVLDAYQRSPAMPALLGESNYEGENNQGESPPTTHLTLRRQLLWSLTSGAAGQFMGSQDWRFLSGWQERLDTPAVAQQERLNTLLAKLPWWQLQPDTSNRLVTAGRGTRLTADTALDVLQNDYVTASRTPDGRLAVIYLPSQHTITVNRKLLAANVTATWVDPASGQIRRVPMASTFAAPGANADGDHDWLLVLEAP